MERDTTIAAVAALGVVAVAARNGGAQSGQTTAPETPPATSPTTTEPDDYAEAEPDGPTSVTDETGANAPVREAEDEGGYDSTEHQASDEHSYEEPDYNSPASDDAVEDVSHDEGESMDEFEDEWSSAMPEGY